MKNNKGFTLVELLAVIVVLAIIIGIAVPSAISVSNKSKVKMYKTKIDLILRAAELYAQDIHRADTIPVGTLAQKGYIKYDTKYTKDGNCVENPTGALEEKCIENPINGKSMNDYHVQIITKNNRYVGKIKCTKNYGTGNKYTSDWNTNDLLTQDYLASVCSP